MELAWVAGLAVLLLVAGLSALSVDTLRRKQGKHPFSFPDRATSMLEDEELESLIRAAQAPVEPEAASNEAKGPKAVNPRRPLPRPNVSFPKISRVPRRRIARPQPGRRAILLVGAGSALLVALSLAAYSFASRPLSSPQGTFVVAVCSFSGAPARDQNNTLAADLSQIIAVENMRAVVVPCGSRPANVDQAGKELSGIRAGLLVWGTQSASGEIGANLLLAPDAHISAANWQILGAHDPGEFSLPAQLSVHLTASTGTAPLEPIVQAILQLEFGKHRAALRASQGAQAVFDGSADGTASGQSLEAAAAGATGRYSDTLTLLDQLPVGAPLAATDLANRAAARLRLGDFFGAKSDLDAVVAERATPEGLLERALVLRARVSRMLGDHTAAQADLDTALKLAPQSLSAHYEKARLLYSDSQPDVARAELDTVIRGAPSAAPAHTLYALVWLMLDKQNDALAALDRSDKLYSGWLAELRRVEAQTGVTGDLEAREQATAGILELNGELASVHLYKGMALADLARKEPNESFFGGLWRRIRGQSTTNEKAIAELQEAQRLSPRRPDILIQMGQVYANSGDTGAAAEQYKAALQASPGSPEPYLALSRLYSGAGNVSEAAKTLEQLIAAAPRNYEAYEALSNLYSGAGNAPAAKDALERGTAVAPQTASDHLWRGKFLYSLGRSGEAIPDLQVAAADPRMWQAHVLQGQILESGNQDAAALDQFRAALQVQPNDPGALLEAGKLLVLAGQPDEAEKLFMRLSALAPTNVEGHIAYADLLTGKGDLDKAVDEGRKAVQYAPNNGTAHFVLGRVYEARREWPSASAQYEAAVAHDPNQFEALVRWSVSLFMQDKYTEAEDTAGKAIAIRGDDPQPYRWKAEAQLALLDTDGALATIGEALRLNPAFQEALALTSRAYAGKGDTASAIAYAKQAQTVAPSNPLGFIAEGDALLAANDPRAAWTAYSSALDLGQGNLDAYVGQGRAAAAVGDLQGAIKAFNSASTSDKTFAPSHLYAGQAFSGAGRWDEAYAEFARAAQLRPNWPQALYYMGRAYLQRKDLTNARAAFDAATKGSPNFVDAWYYKGVTHRDLNQRPEAISAFQRATTLQPAYAEAWLFLGLTLEESNRRDEAKEAFIRARDLATDKSIREQAQQALARVN